MKSIALFCAFAVSSLTSADGSAASSAAYVQKAGQLQLASAVTWQRLMYAGAAGQSEVSYSGYFMAPEGRQNLQKELNANIQALFQAAEADQSVRCRFPARSQWLIAQLQIPQQQLPRADCPELDSWFGKIKPYKATLIYATDFMGNPSSMFGHTLLRIDPKDQQQLNLVSYAINYAATVASADSWSFAWKGLTGQYPGEYSLMPYYRKVKEYGDFESRDLWEYELNLTEAETRFLVQHIWEMRQVTFPYYFVSDNCAYRLLGLLDLVRPELNLTAQFNTASIPIETIKAAAQQGLAAKMVYRPALETQLLAQAKQHGNLLAKSAHQLAFSEPAQMAHQLADHAEADRAKILEMAYDDLYLHLTSRKAEGSFAQPRLRQLLVLRSQIPLEKQRQDAARPHADPSKGHHARNLSFKAGEVQGDSFIELGHRQAYHDLIDPQGGFRTGTQLMFLDGSIQYRNEQFKLNHFDFLSVNSYNPVTPFKTPLTWGFNLGWQQESLDSAGQFTAQDQHGVASLKMQAGYSWANSDRTHLCYAQMQTQIQGGKALEQGWRAGAGPAAGCQNVWTDKMNTLVQAELPYWPDAAQWNLKLGAQVQYALDAQNALRLGWEYQQQNGLNWDQASVGYIHFF